MIGVVTDDAAGVKQRAFEKGVLLNAAGGALRFLPSLAATDEELDELVDRLNF